tara:strand:+ start:254 stop:604 length:351 start_codon:yes stop_codon:yes gene_type:complete
LLYCFSIGPLTYGPVKAGYSAENMSAPKALFDELPDLVKELFGVIKNCWYSITLNAPACLLCLITNVVSPVDIIATLVHPIVRFIYIGAYVGDILIARGLCWRRAFCVQFLRINRA